MSLCQFTSYWLKHFGPEESSADWKADNAPSGPRYDCQHLRVPKHIRSSPKALPGRAQIYPNETTLLRFETRWGSRREYGEGRKRKRTGEKEGAARKEKRGKKLFWWCWGLEAGNGGAGAMGLAPSETSGSCSPGAILLIHSRIPWLTGSTPLPSSVLIHSQVTQFSWVDQSPVLGVPKSRVNHILWSFT